MKTATITTRILASTLAVVTASSLCLHAATINLDLTTTNPGAISLGSGNNTFGFDSFSINYLIVAGGGGGGGATTSASTTSGGGGGAGGLLQATTTITGLQNITVGAGSAGGNGGTTSSTQAGQKGDDSIAFGLTAYGGQGGGRYDTNLTVGGPFGSGGGAAARGSSDGGTGGTGTPGQGFNGGNRTSTSGNNGGAGGGGAGGPGADNIANGTGRAGGVGVNSNITGSNVTYAGGGGGGGTTTTAGASATGGVGGTSAANGSNGWDNTGGGGGGGGTGGSRSGGAGGSGIVVVRYTGSQVLTGGTVTTVGGDTVHQFLNTGASTLDMYSATINGDISGDGNLVWDKAGTLNLNGTNAYTGTTTISSGTLQIGNGGTTGSLGTGLVTNNGALVFNRSDVVTVTNDISGTGSVEHAGSGTLSFTGTFSSSSTSVTGGGTLVASGSLGDVSVDTTSGGTFDIGTGITTVVVDSLSLIDGSVIRWQYNGGTSADKIDATGDLETDLDLTGLTNIIIDIEAVGGAAPKGTTFTLFDGEVNYGGTFDPGIFTLRGPTAQYWEISAGSLILTSIIPEPSTALLAGLGLAGLTLRRRRRTA